MARVAQCSCGSLRAEANGEPIFVQVCNCTECQRRTGSVLGVTAIFLKSEVHTNGPSRVYVRRDGRVDRKVRLHFCPECGTTVYAEPDARPNIIGVFVGTFGDRNFPAPTRSIWERSQHSWIAFNLESIQHFPEAPPELAL